MLRSIRLLAAACGTACVLALAAGSAAGNVGIRLEPAGEITKVVDAFTMTAFGGEVSITCRLTLRGRLQESISKASAGLLPEGRMGNVGAAATEGCRTNFGGGAEVIVLVEPGAPVPLRYEAFLGALPGITGLQFTKLRFGFRVLEPAIIGNCLYSGNVRLLLSFPPVEEARGRFNPEAFVVPNAVPLFEGMLCPPEVQVSGRGRVFPPQVAVLTE